MKTDWEIPWDKSWLLISPLNKEFFYVKYYVLIVYILLVLISLLYRGIRSLTVVDAYILIDLDYNILQFITNFALLINILLILILQSRYNVFLNQMIVKWTDLSNYTQNN